MAEVVSFLTSYLSPIWTAEDSFIDSRRAGRFKTSYECISPAKTLSCILLLHMRNINIFIQHYRKRKTTNCLCPNIKPGNNCGQVLSVNGDDDLVDMSSQASVTRLMSRLAVCENITEVYCYGIRGNYGAESTV